jgi:hypothetical protein
MNNYALNEQNENEQKETERTEKEIGLEIDVSVIGLSDGVMSLNRRDGNSSSPQSGRR